MKIVFIGCRDIRSIGGIESYMANLTIELVKLGHQPILYCESDKNSVETYNGVTIIHCTGLKSNLLCKPWVSLKATIRTLLKEKDVSIIHYNAWPPSLWCFLPRMFGIKSMMQGHGLEWQRSKYTPIQQRIMKFMEWLTAHMNQHLIMCSEGQTQYFKDKYNIISETIPTAVKLPAALGIDEQETLLKYGLESKKYFLFVGRLVQDKNPDYLIDGFKSSMHRDMKLVIAGNNDANPKYVNYLYDLAADNKDIIFTGAVFDAEKDALFRNAYAFCLPSTIEGLSIVLLEAMSYKLPVIASDIDANRELLGDSAVWVRPENTHDIRNAIEYCINNTDIIDAYQSINYNKVVKNYIWDKVALKYVAHVESLLSNS